MSRRFRVSFSREEVQDDEAQFVFAFKMKDGSRVELSGRMNGEFIKNKVRETIAQMHKENAERKESQQ